MNRLTTQPISQRREDYSTNHHAEIEHRLRRFDQIVLVTDQVPLQRQQNVVVVVVVLAVVDAAVVVLIQVCRESVRHDLYQVIVVTTDPTATTTP